MTDRAAQLRAEGRDIISLSVGEPDFAMPPHVADAVRASGLLELYPQAAGLAVGIWGRQAEPGTVLRMHDRVEIYRPLRCDPKEARRLRYRQKAERSRSLAGVSGNPRR